MPSTRLIQESSEDAVGGGTGARRLSFTLYLSTFPNFEVLRGRFPTNSWASGYRVLSGMGPTMGAAPGPL